MTPVSGMTAAGATLVASWLAGSPPLQELRFGCTWCVLVLLMGAVDDGVGLCGSKP